MARHVALHGEGTLPHLLVVDDDPDIRAILRDYLSGNGFRVSTAENAAAFRSAIAGGVGPVDLVLLDVGLPDANGFDLLRELRGTWHGPVIMVTGHGEPVDRVVGLELGADDYIAKPFERREVLARVRSVLRRVRPAHDPASPGRLEFDGLVLEPGPHRLYGRDGEEIPLTAGEFALLEALATHPDHVFSRDQLMDRLHGRAPGPFDRAIDVQVGRLRRKIERDPGRPRLVRAVRGSGYLLSGPVARSGG